MAERRAGRKAYTLAQLRGAFVAGKNSGDNTKGMKKFFHTFVDGKIDRQGHVMFEYPKGQYTVQWYSWADGGPTTTGVITAEVIARCVFYDSEEAWRAEGNRLSEVTQW